MNDILFNEQLSSCNTKQAIHKWQLQYTVWNTFHGSCTTHCAIHSCNTHWSIHSVASKIHSVQYLVWQLQYTVCQTQFCSWYTKCGRCNTHGCSCNTQCVSRNKICCSFNTQWTKKTFGLQRPGLNEAVLQTMFNIRYMVQTSLPIYSELIYYMYQLSKVA